MVFYKTLTERKCFYGITSFLGRAIFDLKKLTSVEKLSEEFQESVRQIQRNIRLTYLNEPILDMADENLIALRPAVEISCLSKENQEYLLDFMQLNECAHSHAQTIKLHKLEKEGQLTTYDIDNIMLEEKSNQVKKYKYLRNGL